jgi:hypothetical protein
MKLEIKAFSRRRRYRNASYNVNIDFGLMESNPVFRAYVDG